MSGNTFDSNGVLREGWDDTTRTVTTYDETGAVASSRPYTADENANADAAAQAQADANAARARAETHEAILDATAALMVEAHTDGQPWVQPTGAHDAYAKGDRVNFNGQDYESLIDGNTWSPSDYPAGWKAIA